LQRRVSDRSCPEENAFALLSGRSLTKPKHPMSIFERLPAFDKKSGYLQVVIDTPKGRRNKFAYDFEKQTYVLKSVLPEGMVFPFDFGSIPGTRAPDGDPLDALVLMDEPTFCGCLVEARLLGVIEANQTDKEKGGEKKERNDRLIAVAAESLAHEKVKALKDLDSALLDQIEHFFVNYNLERGRKFTPLGRRGIKHAEKLVRKQRREG
jgi:inorganic pyrophosphatase